MSLPTFTDFSPAANSVGAQRNAPVFFKIRSADGINLSSIRVLIEGILVIDSGVFQPGYYGTIHPEDLLNHVVAILISHTVDFSYNQEVNVAMKATDTLNNTGNGYYRFIVTSSSDRTNPDVVANPHGGLFNSSQNITLTSTESNCNIYYTMDGSDPSLYSTHYVGPIGLTDGKTTLKFLAVDSSDNIGTIRAEVYDINSVAPITTASPTGGNLYNSISVELTCSDSKATIYYTTTGTIPNNVYSVPVFIPENKKTTLRFFAKDKYGNIESTKIQVYNVELFRNNIIPTNIFVTTPYIKGILDIRWEDMYPINNKVIGYNVYRADVELGPWKKLNKNVIGVNQYQDSTLDLEIVEEDVSNQFKRTVSISSEVNDDFQGDKFNCKKWIQNDYHELLFQYNGCLFIDKVGLQQESRLTSVFKLRADFDIQINYDLLVWNQPNLSYQSCLFRVKKDDRNFIQVGRERSQSVDVYSTNKFVNGNPDLPVSIATSVLNSSFRITRVGNVISTFFLETGGWVLVNAFTSFTEDLYVEIAGTSADVNVQLRWSSFIVSSGYPFIIEPLVSIEQSALVEKVNNKLQYTIQTSKFPIVDDSGTHQSTDLPQHVTVTINGVVAKIRELRGLEGVIVLETDKKWDEVKRTWIISPVPDENSVVLVTYKVNVNSINTALRKNYFYKVTCVTAEDETDLDLVKPEYLAPEKVDYIYEEAIRRNQWLLDQAGERALLFIKKKAGETCRCLKHHDLKERTDARPESDCQFCYGAGFEGGYDGPFTIIIAPLTTEQRITQTDRGIMLKYQIETWMGPSPLLSQRDLIIRRNYDRVGIGPITRVEGPKGSIVQQHFVIEPIDTTDIRYKLPLQPLPNWVQRPDKPGTTDYQISSPKETEELITDKGVDHVVRGRTINFSNVNY